MLSLDIAVNFGFNSKKTAGFQGTEASIKNMSTYIANVETSLGRLKTSLNDNLETLGWIGAHASTDAFTFLSESVDNYVEALVRSKKITDGFEKKTAELLEKQRLLDTKDAAIEGLRNYSTVMGFTEKEMAKLEQNLLISGPKAWEVYTDMLKKYQKAQEDGNGAVKKFYSEKLVRLNKGLEESSQSFIEHAKAVDQTKKGYLGASDGLDNYKRKLSSMGQFVKNFVRVGSVIEIISQIGEAHEASARAVYSLGLENDRLNQSLALGEDRVRTTEKGAAAFMDQARQSSTQTQLRLTETTQMMGRLAELRVTRNIDELGQLATTAGLMSHALGVSSDQAAEFTKDLMVIGGLGAKDVESAATALVNVKNTMGLTGEEAQNVIAQVGTMMRRFRAFGGSSRQVAIVTREVGRLTSAFKSAGLEAGDANQILNQMLDPSKMKENVMLWQGLGMSASQGWALMHGDGQQLEGMTEKMTDLAVRLNKQYGNNIFALQAMSEAHGLQLSTVQALVANREKLVNLTAQERREMQLAEAADAARAGLMSKMQRIWNSLSVIITTAVEPIVDMLAPALESIAEGLQDGSTQFEKFFLTAEEVSSLFENIKGATIFLSKALKALAKYGGTGGILALVFAPAILKFVFTILPSLAGGVVALGKALWFARKAAAAGGKGGFFSSLFGGASGGGGIASTAGQLAALALVILSVGASIAVAAAGISLLARSIKDLDKDQLNALQVMVGILAVSAVAAGIGMSVLGKSSAGAAPGLWAVVLPILGIGLAIGVAAAGIGVMAWGLGTLTNAFANLFKQVGGDQMWEFLGQLGTLSLALASFVISGPLFLSGVAFIAMGIASLATALILFGGPVERFSYNMERLSNSFENITGFAQQAKAAISDFLSTVDKDYVAQVKLVYEGLEQIPDQNMITMLKNSLVTRIAGNQTDVDGGSMSRVALATEEISSKIDQSNAYLSTISLNTKNANAHLDTMKREIATMRKDFGKIKTLY